MHFIEYFSEDSTARDPGLGGWGFRDVEGMAPILRELGAEARTTSTERRELEESRGREGSGFHGRGHLEGSGGRVQEGRNWVCARSPTRFTLCVSYDGETEAQVKRWPEVPQLVSVTGGSAWLFVHRKQG